MDFPWLSKNLNSFTNMARPGDPLDLDVERFEALVDKDNPEQMSLLETIREQTRRLHQARGDWNKNSNYRIWNDPKPRVDATPPLRIESYRWGGEEARLRLHAHIVPLSLRRASYCFSKRGTLTRCIVFLQGIQRAHEEGEGQTALVDGDRRATRRAAETD
jgi:hypothetical protein